MIGFIFFLCSPEYRQGLLYGWFFNVDILKLAGQGLITFKILLVFFRCSGSDAKQLASRQRGFEDAGCIHGTIPATGSYQGVNVFDKKYHFSIAEFYIVQQKLKAFFKLSFILGTCNDGRQIKGIDLFV